jgi:hypothetical protein
MHGLHQIRIARTVEARPIGQDLIDGRNEEARIVTMIRSLEIAELTRGAVAEMGRGIETPNHHHLVRKALRHRTGVASKHLREPRLTPGGACVESPPANVVVAV